jgi:hypothetical protein
MGAKDSNALGFLKGNLVFDYLKYLGVIKTYGTVEDFRFFVETKCAGYDRKKLMAIVNKCTRIEAKINSSYREKYEALVDHIKDECQGLECWDEEYSEKDTEEEKTRTKTMISVYQNILCWIESECDAPKENDNTPDFLK